MTTVDQKHKECDAAENNEEQVHTEGGGHCKLCSCARWVPSSGGRTCINLNQEGGTCNHYYHEHE